MSLKALASASALLLVAAPVRADEERPKSVTHDYSPYEKETIRGALEASKSTLDPSPDGKEIEGVDVVTLEVFEERDPLPGWLNVFHVTSRRYTIERELLLKVGDRYDRVLVDETARNLRGLAAQLSVVLVLATKGSSPGKVRVLLVTKDVWSLRLNSSYRLANGHLENLYLEPSEQNFFGTHHIASIQYFLQPLSHYLGAYYKIPWVAGSRVQLVTTAAIILSRESGSAEGARAALTVQQPLFSSRTPWSWKVAGDYRSEVTRVYTNGALALFDSKSTPDPDRIPFQYRSRVATASAAVTRSYGWAQKLDLTIGMQLDARDYRTYDLTPFDALAREDFLSNVPRTDTRVGPFAQLRSYRSDFVRTLDVEILGLQEDFRLGADVVAEIYPIIRAIGSSRNVLGGDVGVQWTERLLDGFARVFVRGTVEAEIDHVADASFESRLRVVTPRLPFGRVVLDLGALQRPRNYLNATNRFGGETRPRGYPTNYLRGPNTTLGSLELRSRSVNILQTLWGVVGFLDAGAAYKTEAGLEPHYGAGVGVRVLLPQFDRLVVRADLGVPLDRHRTADVSPFQFLITVGQAFSVPNVTL